MTAENFQCFLDYLCDMLQKAIERCKLCTLSAIPSSAVKYYRESCTLNWLLPRT